MAESLEHSFKSLVNSSKAVRETGGQRPTSIITHSSIKCSVVLFEDKQNSFSSNFWHCYAFEQDPGLNLDQVHPEINWDFVLTCGTPFVNHMFLVLAYFFFCNIFLS